MVDLALLPVMQTKVAPLRLLASLASQSAALLTLGFPTFPSKSLNLVFDIHNKNCLIFNL